MSPTTRRLTAWLVLFAMALASAAPSFASRASAADLAALGICSLAAHEAQQGDPGHQPQDDFGPLGSNLHHCPLCAPAAHAALPPALFAPSVPPAQFAPFPLPRIQHPPRTAYAGLIWQSRGPPGQA